MFLTNTLSSLSNSSQKKDAKELFSPSYYFSLPLDSNAEELESTLMSMTAISYAGRNAVIKKDDLVRAKSILSKSWDISAVCIGRYLYKDCSKPEDGELIIYPTNQSVYEDYLWTTTNHDYYIKPSEYIANGVIKFDQIKELFNASDFNTSSKFSFMRLIDYDKDLVSKVVDLVPWISKYTDDYLSKMEVMFNHIWARDEFTFIKKELEFYKNLLGTDDLTTYCMLNTILGLALSIIIEEKPFSLSFFKKLDLYTCQTIDITLGDSISNLSDISLISNPISNRPYEKVNINFVLSQFSTDDIIHYFENIHDDLNKKLGTSKVLYMHALGKNFSLDMMKEITDTNFNSNGSLSFQYVYNNTTYIDELFFVGNNDVNQLIPTHRGGRYWVNFYYNRQDQDPVVFSGKLTFTLPVSATKEFVYDNDNEKDSTSVKSFYTMSTLHSELSNFGSLSPADTLSKYAKDNRSSFLIRKKYSNINVFNHKCKQLMLEDSSELNDEEFISLDIISNANSNSFNSQVVENLKVVSGFKDKLKEDERFIFDQSLNNGAIFANDTIESLNDLGDTLNNIFSTAESTILGYMKTASDISDVDKSSQAMSAIESILDETVNSVSELEDTLGISYNYNELPQFSDRVVNNQMKLNAFKIKLSDHLNEKINVIDKYNEVLSSVISEKNYLRLEKATSSDSIDLSAIISSYNNMTKSIDKVIAKSDIQIPNIDINWIGNIMINVIGKLATSIVSAISIIDNMLNILNKINMNFTWNKNVKFMKCTKSDYSEEVGKKCVLFSLPNKVTVNRDFSDKLVNDPKHWLGYSFIPINLSTYKTARYYILMLDDDLSFFNTVKNSLFDDASKLLSLISGELSEYAYFPSSAETSKAWDFVAAQAAIASAAAALVASGLWGKAIAALAAATTVMTINRINYNKWYSNINRKKSMYQVLSKDKSLINKLEANASYLVIDNINYISATEASNISLAKNIATDALSIAAGGVLSVGLGLAFGFTSRLISAFRLRRANYKSILQHDTILVNGVPMKTKNLNWSQKRMIAKQSVSNPDMSSATLATKYGYGASANDIANIESLIKDFRKDFKVWSSVLDENKLNSFAEDITNNNEEKFNEIISATAGLGSQLLLLNKINRKLGF